MVKQQIGGAIGVWADIAATGTFGSSFLGGVGFASADGTVPANNWAHIVYVYDGTKANPAERCAVYINGIFQAYFGNATVPAATGNTSDAAVIGVAYGPSLWYHFKGKIDDVLMVMPVGTLTICVIQVERRFGQRSPTTSKLGWRCVHAPCHRGTGLHALSGLYSPALAV